MSTATTDLTTPPTQAPRMTPAEIATRCRAIITEVSIQILERDTETWALMITMLAGQHAIVIGKPGAAKSALIRLLSRRFVGGTYFEMPMTTYTEPSHIFGPIDMQKLIKGEYAQRLDGYATQCHMAFFDEVFKATEDTLNTMLSFLNERTYTLETGGLIDCPLISAITASNELPAGEESAAFYDRLLVRLEVDYLEKRDSFVSLMTDLNAPVQGTTLALADLRAAVDHHVPAVTLSKQIANIMADLREDLEMDLGLVVSDRRWKDSTRLLKASAFLDGRDHVALPDLAILSHVLWYTPDQQEPVRRRVTKMVDPNSDEILTITDRIGALNTEFTKLKADGASKKDLGIWVVNNTPQIDDVKESLKHIEQKVMRAGGTTPLLEQAQARFREVHGPMVAAMLGQNPYEDLP